MPERDDARAAEILIEYQQGQIDKLENKKENYKRRIAILKDGCTEVTDS